VGPPILEPDNFAEAEYDAYERFHEGSL